MRFPFTKPKPAPVDPHVKFVAALKSDTPIFDDMLREASPSLRASLRRQSVAQTPAGPVEDASSHPNGLSLVSSSGDDGPAGQATGRGDAADQTAAPSGNHPDTR